ncbi:MAG: sulfotransferase family protein [Chloroflexota bacterium]|nr:sulfotransferase family protein [Chloroflexota bacterium]
MTLKIIGAGFGRTGTLSLKLALEALGYTKCYHMQEVFAHPSHVQTWTDAATGKPVDWDKLFTGYQATVDWPGCTFYRELMQHYPDAKVLLSVRDPENWYQSAYNTIFRVGRQFPMNQMPKIVPPLRRFIRMVDAIIWRGTFHGRFADKPYAIAVFNRHIEEVKQIVPPQRLLVYEVKEGWEPLCKFLGVPVPQGIPFPHANDTVQFQQQFYRRIGAALLAIVIAVINILWITSWLRRRTKRPQTEVAA